MTPLLHSRKGSLTALVLTFVLVAVRGTGSAQGELTGWLTRPLLAPDQSLHEVQKFCEDRVPRVAEARSAGKWEHYADQLRRDTLDKIVFRGDQAKSWRDAQTKIVWLETIPGGPGYHLRKVRYEALPGLWIPAVLYEPEKLSNQAPVHLAVNGHDANGKAAPYKQMRCINLAKRGVISLNVEWLGMGQLRTPGFTHYKMNQLDLCGVSGLAPYYLAMSRGLDVLLRHPHADPARVAVSGLSGGGWQTIFISSLDTRVTLCNPVAGYSSFFTRARFLSDLGDSAQTPNDLATVVDYAHLTAMMGGRALLLTKNAKDQCCFAADHALEPLRAAAGPVFDLYGQATRFRAHINYDPGTHNFEQDNREALYRFVGDMFFPNERSWSAKEIPSEAEIKDRAAFEVALPADNLDFHQLASKLSRGLPREPQKATTTDLRNIVHYHKFGVEAERVGTERSGSTTASFWRLRMGGFTVPAIEVTKGEPHATTILTGDNGRKDLASEIEALLNSGRRVIVVDPFYFGESKIPQRDFLFALLVAAVGERPLGIQSSQLAAVSRWAKGEFKSPVELVAHGPRLSLAALVATALERGAIERAELHEALQSLHEIIDEDWSVNQKPELFCFGLLERFDIARIKELAGAGRVIEQ